MTIAAVDLADWQEQAACAGQDTSLWFPDNGQDPTAKRICGLCPVRAECLYDSLRHETAGARRYGIRGGLNGFERNRIPPLPTSRAAALAALREVFDRLPTPEPNTAERNDQTMTTTSNPETTPTPAAEPVETIPLGQLLKWGDDHRDTEVQDQAARARAALTGLRQRYAADRELTAISSEREQLEKRLAELQAREQEIAPAKPKKARKPVDYPAAEVRAWAKENGVDCPPVGRVPNTVVAAWRQATSTPA